MVGLGFFSRELIDVMNPLVFGLRCPRCAAVAEADPNLASVRGLAGSRGMLPLPRAPACDVRNGGAGINAAYIDMDV